MLVCPAEFTDDELRLVLGPLTIQLGICRSRGQGQQPYIHPNHLTVDNGRLGKLTR